MIQAFTDSSCNNVDSRFFKIYHDGSNNNYPQSIDSDSSSNYYICGYDSGQDAYYMKLNNLGTFQYGYEISLSTSGNSHCYDIHVPQYPSDQTYFYVTGNLNMGGTQSLDLFLGKITASSGVYSWFKAYGGTSSEYAYQAITDYLASSIYIVGQSNSISDLSGEIFYAKFDTSGNMKFYYQHGCENNDWGQSIVLDRYNTSFYSLGATNCFHTSSSALHELSVFKFNSSFHIQWGTYIGTSRNDYPEKLLQNPVTDYLIILGYDYVSASVYKPCIIYLNDEGIIEWQYSLGGVDGTDILYSGYFSPDGNFLYTIGQFYSTTMMPNTGSPYLVMVKINVNTEAISYSVQLSKTFYTYGVDMILDINNNVILLGQLLYSGYYDMFVTKFQLNMQDWDCYTQNTFTLSSASFTQDFFPMKINVYDDIPSTYTITTLASTFFNVISLTNYLYDYEALGLCNIYSLVSPTNTPSYYTYYLNEAIKIPINSFYYCPFGKSATLGSIYQIGLEDDITSLNGLVKDTSGGYISGTAQSVGTFSILFVSQFTDSTSLPSILVETWCSVTYRVIGTSAITRNNGFYLDPDTTKILYPYTYALNITEFFTYTNTIYEVYANQSVLNSDGVTYSNTTLPSWLTFYSSNYSFYGVPTITDYLPYKTSFPIELNLFLTVVDTMGQSNSTSTAILTITNFDPYYNSETDFKSSYCLDIGTEFYIKIPQNTFLDDDLHPLTYTISDSGGSTFPIDYIYFDSIENSLIGIPTTEQNYYFIINANDSYSSASVDLNLYVSEAPYYGSCSTLRGLSINKKSSSTQYYDYSQCLLDQDSDLIFSANVYPQQNLPSCININSQTGLLTINPKSSLCNGYYDILVTATDSTYGCSSIGYETILTLNTPISSLRSAYQYLYTRVNQYFIYQIDIDDYFYDPDTNDTLTLTMTTTPSTYCSWLSYSNIENTFFGIPSDSGLSGNICYATITAEDFYTTSATVTFAIKMSNETSDFELLFSSLNYTLISNQDYQIELPSVITDTIYNRQLIISVLMNDTLDSLPSWMTFQVNQTSFIGVAPNLTISQSYYPILFFYDYNQTMESLILNITVVPNITYEYFTKDSYTIIIYRDSYFDKQVIDLVKYGFSNTDTIDMYPSDDDVKEWLYFNSRNLSFIGLCCGDYSMNQFQVNLTTYSSVLTKSVSALFYFEIKIQVNKNTRNADPFQWIMIALVSIGMLINIMMSQQIAIKVNKNLDQVNLRYSLRKMNFSMNTSQIQELNITSATNNQDYLQK